MQARIQEVEASLLRIELPALIAIFSYKSAGLVADAFGWSSIAKFMDYTMVVGMGATIVYRNGMQKSLLDAQMAGMTLFNKVNELRHSKPASTLAMEETNAVIIKKSA